MIKIGNFVIFSFIYFLRHETKQTIIPSDLQIISIWLSMIFIYIILELCLPSEKGREVGQNGGQPNSIFFS